MSILRMSMRFGGKIGLVCLVSFLGTACVAAPAGSADTTSLSSCSDRVVTDYLQPLQKVRPRANLRSGEMISLAGVGLRLRLANLELMDHPGRVAFILASARRDQRSSPAESWSAETTLTQVDRNGRPEGRVRKTHQKLERFLDGRVDTKTLGGFRVPSHPRVYRLAVTFTGPHREQRHTYRVYLRVVKHQIDTRLATSSASVLPGDTLTWQVQNFGTTSLTFGLEYQVERYDGGWYVDPMTPAGFPAIGFSIPAGAAGQCQSLTVPASASPGNYRIVKPVDVAAGRPQVVLAPFTVDPPR
jgi:hypothetical protein